MNCSYVFGVSLSEPHIVEAGNVKPLDVRWTNPLLHVIFDVACSRAQSRQLRHINEQQGTGTAVETPTARVCRLQQRHACKTEPEQINESARYALQLALQTVCFACMCLLSPKQSPPTSKIS